MRIRFCPGRNDMRFARCSIPGVMPALVCNLLAGAALADDLPSPDRLSALSARFAPGDIKVDVSALPAPERAALAKLVEASRYVDALFMRQRFVGNEALLLQLL